MPDTDAPGNSDKHSFWATLPGILTGIAGVIGAVTALIVGLKEANLIGQSSTAPPAAVNATSSPAGDATAKPDTASQATSPAAETAPGEGAAFQADPTFRKDFAEYLKRPDYKAFSVGVDAQGDWEYDWSDGNASQAEAEADATADCQEIVSAAQSQATCKIYARGNSVVW